MKRRFTSLLWRNHQSGQAGVEFTLAAVLFVMVTFGLIELGVAVYTYNTVNHAASECVRYAIVHSPTGPNPATNSEIKQVVENDLQALSSDQLTVTVTWPADSNLPSQDDAQCVVSYNYQVEIPFASAASRTLTLTSTSRMLVSQ